MTRPTLILFLALILPYIGVSMSASWGEPRESAVIPGPIIPDDTGIDCGL